jgi:catechol 2,3-dioxygenase-like lactoylglutathione lyase family enzyme
MDITGLESVILFVADLASARAFYVDGLGLPAVFEDDVIVVLGNPSWHVVLHRNDRGHDERGGWGRRSFHGGGPRRLRAGCP